LIERWVIFVILIHILMSRELKTKAEGLRRKINRLDILAREMSNLCHIDPYPHVQGVEDWGGGTEEEDQSAGHPGERDDENTRGLFCSQESLKFLYLHASLETSSRPYFNFICCPLVFNVSYSHTEQRRLTFVRK
jgi:hypothetical protein